LRRLRQGVLDEGEKTGGKQLKMKERKKEEKKIRSRMAQFTTEPERKHVGQPLIAVKVVLAS
jgi:hypothetical protein